MPDVSAPPFDCFRQHTGANFQLSHTLLQFLDMEALAHCVDFLRKDLPGTFQHPSTSVFLLFVFFFSTPSQLVSLHFKTDMLTDYSN